MMTPPYLGLHTYTNIHNYTHITHELIIAVFILTNEFYDIISVRYAIEINSTSILEGYWFLIRSK